MRFSPYVRRAGADSRLQQSATIATPAFCPYTRSSAKSLCGLGEAVDGRGEEHREVVDEGELRDLVLVRFEELREAKCYHARGRESCDAVGSPGARFFDLLEVKLRQRVDAIKRGFGCWLDSPQRSRELLLDRSEGGDVACTTVEDDERSAASDDELQNGLAGLVECVPAKLAFSRAAGYGLVYGDLLRILHLHDEIVQAEVTQQLDLRDREIRFQHGGHSRSGQRVEAKARNNQQVPMLKVR